jgi:hypothetical protein
LLRITLCSFALLGFGAAAPAGELDKEAGPAKAPVVAKSGFGGGVIASAPAVPTAVGTEMDKESPTDAAHYHGGWGHGGHYGYYGGGYRGYYGGYRGYYGGYRGYYGGYRGWGYGYGYRPYYRGYYGYGGWGWGYPYVGVYLGGLYGGSYGYPYLSSYYSPYGYGYGGYYW